MGVRQAGVARPEGWPQRPCRAWRCGAWATAWGLLTALPGLGGRQGQMQARCARRSTLRSREASDGQSTHTRAPTAEHPLPLPSTACRARARRATTAAHAPLVRAALADLFAARRVPRAGASLLPRLRMCVCARASLRAFSSSGVRALRPFVCSPQVPVRSWGRGARFEGGASYASSPCRSESG